MTLASSVMLFVSNAQSNRPDVQPAMPGPISIKTLVGTHAPTKHTTMIPLKLVNCATTTALYVPFLLQIAAFAIPSAHTFLICSMETHAQSIVVTISTLKTMEAQDPTLVSLVMLNVSHVPLRPPIVPAV